ncbi:MAG: alpha/beta hydrolase fold protein [Mucilaginibacter sp.]|nr:alpha/beta hydrolase fold protein [Mucilaginibacter sp.]
MKTIIYAALWLLLLSSFKTIASDTLISKHGYSEVNGIKMYYEIYGQGKPLVLIHGGGSNIQTTFGRVIPMLAKKYKIIAMDLQAHGHTSDREAPESFEQDADDVAALLKNLNVSKADFFGFSNGGTTAVQIAIRHPGVVGKLVLASALCKRNGVPAQFYDFMKQATLANMPGELKEAYLKDTPSPNGLQIMHDKDAKRMVDFKDILDEQIEAIKAPTLIIIGDEDVIKPEHALEMHKQIAGSSLAIVPGGHGEYIEEITTLKSNSKEAAFVIPMIEGFLDK